MRYHALACDYDGTIAHHGIVDTPTLEALQRVKASGRKLLLVTGRELEDLLGIFPHPELFDRLVVENGALLYDPATREERRLGEPPPREFVDLLRSRGVNALSVGRVIVATQEPYETVVLEAIRALGLELQVIFNKGAVMVLPSGINKATGLKAALKVLGLSPHNIVGVGDAENDHAFLEFCEASVAVANALPALKQRADIVTDAGHGSGVAELIERLLKNDLREIDDRLKHHTILVGLREDDGEFRLKPYGVNVLVAGTSGGGKSSFVTGFVERLVEQKYQACLIDPEGDYPQLENFLVFGDSNRAPALDEVMKALEQPNESVVVNLVGVRLEDRPDYFQRLLPKIYELRARTGRPHWIVVDETHHLLPEGWQPSSSMIPKELHGLMLVTVHPHHVAPEILSHMNLIVSIGASPAQTIREYCDAAGESSPAIPPVKLEPGEALIWWRGSELAPVWLRLIPPRTARRRHVRKYMDGELPADRSFYFEGPDRKLHLRAQNLRMFIQLGDGVDDRTWDFHLHRGDYSKWFREEVHDETLAQATEQIERGNGAGSQESRHAIRELIEERYTAPA
jgi:HAD superfamily hydrolase (TIGR01484 family)